MDWNLLAPYMAVMGTSPFLEQIIEYLKDQWRVPTKLAPLVALGLGALSQIVVMVYNHALNGTPLDFFGATMFGLATGFTTSFWHEVTSK